MAEKTNNVLHRVNYVNSFGNISRDNPHSGLENQTQLASPYQLKTALPARAHASSTSEILSQTAAPWCSTQ